MLGEFISAVSPAQCRSSDGNPMKNRAFFLGLNFAKLGNYEDNFKLWLWLVSVHCFSPDTVRVSDL